jgi:hypothetical protein
MKILYVCPGPKDRHVEVDFMQRLTGSGDDAYSRPNRIVGIIADLRSDDVAFVIHYCPYLLKHENAPQIS